MHGSRWPFVVRQSVLSVSAHLLLVSSVNMLRQSEYPLLILRQPAGFGYIFGEYTRGIYHPHGPACCKRASTSNHPRYEYHALVPTMLGVTTATPNIPTITTQTVHIIIIYSVRPPVNPASTFEFGLQLDAADRGTTLLDLHFRPVRALWKKH